jgi:carboxynorspermidine decarboxylase
VFEPQNTPAYIYDERQLRSDVQRVGAIARNVGCKPLYSPKANTLRGVLDVIAVSVDGFAASSVFEARLSREVLGRHGSIHLTNPGLRTDEVAEVVTLCNYVTLNSLSQWQMYGPALSGQLKCGLRVNPGMSLVRDLRYDPCRVNSKLGVPLEYLEEIHCQAPGRIEGVSGLHFHTNSEASEFSGLLATVRHLADRIGPFLEKMEWVNLGGGYLFDEPDTLGEFDVAMLDATTNHWPEVFEYEFAPDVIGDTEEGEYEYLLAGGTCLAGDLFGTYAFDEPLDVGSKIVFSNAGAYSLVKANYFNGINLPSIYALTAEGELVLEKKFTFEDFARQCGAVEHENN